MTKIEEQPTPKNLGTVGIQISAVTREDAVIAIEEVIKQIRDGDTSGIGCQCDENSETLSTFDWYCSGLKSVPDNAYFQVEYKEVVTIDGCEHITIKRDLTESANEALKRGDIDRCNSDVIDHVNDAILIIDPWNDGIFNEEP